MVLLDSILQDAPAGAPEPRSIALSARQTSRRIVFDDERTSAVVAHRDRRLASRPAT